MHRDIQRSLHPCFNKKVKGRCGRVHLPVAPRCNIKCNYCDRKYDCVNESRPGVASAVLSPHQAVTYLQKVIEREPRITVAGIAGPGDPFANPDETLTTLRLVRGEFPDMLLCLATNGLAIAAYVEDLASIGVTHVTITINAVDASIGSKIYAWVRDGKVVYRGCKGAGLLIERQLEAVHLLKEAGITVKANFIAIPGVNTTHAKDVAQTLKETGVDLMNCMAIFPTPGTPLGDVAQPTKADMEALRETVQGFIPQMRHCTRCRADAIGLLGDDKTDEFRSCLARCAREALDGSRERKYVAVATREGLLVNQHLGEANYLEIWEFTKHGPNLIERRPTPKPGQGLKRWIRLAELLRDCRFLLVSGIGDRPKEVLKVAGINPLEVNGLIEECIEQLYTGGNLNLFKKGINMCENGAKKWCL